MRDFQKLWNEKPWWKEGTTDKEMAEFYYKKGLEAKTEPVAEVPCSAGLSDYFRDCLTAAFIDGYENGHNDTVESAYSDAEDRAKDWLEEQIKDGRFEGR